VVFFSILVFFFIFSVIILIHEWGHFASARRHGVHVEEFGLGVPPKAKTLWTDKKGCAFTLNWIPFGGFVRMEGEDAADEGIKKTKGSFASKSILARMEIILAGVFMNFVLAIFLLTILFSVGTKPILLNKEAVLTHIEQGTIILDEGLPVLAVSEGGPAYISGLQKGDVLLSINGQNITSSEEILALQSANEIARYNVYRTNEDGMQQKIQFQVQANEEGKIKAAFSMLPSFKEVKDVQLPVHQAFVYSLKVSGEIAQATVHAFKSLITRLVLHAEVPQGIAGPVGIASMTHNIVEQGDISGIFKFMALLSLSLAIMNVLPIPALDGGRFVFLIIEAIIRRPIKASWEANINLASYALLLGLIALITWNDIVRIFTS